MGPRSPLRSKRLWLVGFGFLVLTFLSPLRQMTQAQVDTGTILGTVRDQSGAVVPGAKVTLIHEGTSFTLSALTREDGGYIFTPIRIGTYRVEAEYGGFQKAVRSGVQLNIQQQAVVDFTLVPGEVTQTVEVTAAVPLLQTESGSVGEAVTGEKIINLPLSGRNYTFLARLTAGVTIAQPEGRGLNGNGWFAANGTRPAQNNYLLDGIDNNSNNVDFLSGAATVVKPPIDAIGEFKVQTSAFSAEFGRAGGAVLNVTLKSGTNEIHGSAWEFLRNNHLDANNFFANQAGLEKGQFQQNQFGAAVGGPLIKNKTFWFVDYEGTRIRQARIWSGLTVPTASQRNAGFTDFSDLITGQSGTRGPDLLGRTVPLGTIFDPATTRPVTAGQVDPVTGLTATATGSVRDAFPGNRIPANRLSPNAVKLLSLYPGPTAAGLFRNYTVNRTNMDDTDAIDVRIDHNFTSNDQIFGRYSFADAPKFRPGPFEGVADGGGFGDGEETLRTQGAALSWTHTFSRTLINEARVGFGREHNVRLQAFGNDTSDIPGKYGIPGIVQTPGNGGLPFFGIGSLAGLGSSNWLVSERFSNTYQLTQNLTKLYKSHSFKGGFQIQHIEFPWTAPPTSRGNFSFNGAFTSIPNNRDASTGIAQFLLSPIASTVPNGVNFLGGSNSVSASNFGSVANNKDYYGAYFQDDWKVSPKLTLNLGLRWDHFSLVGEDYGAQANFVPGPPGAGAKFVIPAQRKSTTISPGFVSALAKDGIELVYTDDFGTGLGRSQKKNFAPRFGFAYQATSKFVVRGGYGIYYGAFENRGGAPNLGYNYPFQYSFSFPAVNDVTPVTYPDGTTGTLERGFLGIPLNPAAVSGSGLYFRAIEFNYKTPYTQSYNLTTQYQLRSSDSIEVGYVASLSRHIEAFTGTNHVRQILPPGTNRTPYLLYPTFAPDASYATTNGNSHYHSMQTKYTRRMSKGLDFLAAYTWAKTLTNAGDLLSGGNVGGFRAPELPGFGIKKDMGLASFHIKHAFAYSGIYEFPFGRGKALGGNLSGVGDAILGGWSTNWILTLYSGQPQTIGCTRATTAGLGCNALLTGQPLYPANQTINQFYNPAAFANPPVATTIGQTDFAPLGGAGTQVTGPSFRQLDLSLFKSFKPSEGTRLEFRTEVFNLTNTPSFNAPGSLDFTNPNNFAVITSTRNFARQIQFALKFYW